jgi:MATE family multidrug resistance protein
MPELIDNDSDCQVTQMPPPASAMPNGGGYAEVWKLAYPVVITMASMSIMGVVDTLFMKWVGTAEQGAAGLGATLAWTLMSFFNGTITGISTFVAQFFGAKKYEDCGKVTWQSFYWVLFSTVMTIGIVLPLSGLLVEAIGSSPAVTKHSSDYLDIRLYGCIFVFINFAIVGFFRGIGDTRTPMIITLIVNILNVGVSYLLVFGVWGFPKLGLVGAALGTVISQAIASGIYIYYFVKPKQHQKYQTRIFQSFDLALAKRLLSVGAPIGLWWILQMAGWTVFTVFISTLGDASLAGHSIVRRLMHLSFLPGAAVGVAATTLVGQYIGAKDIPSAEKSAQTAIKIGMMIMGSMGILFFLLRYQLAALFSKDPAVIEIAATLFIFAAIIELFDAVGTISGGAIRGAGDTRWPMYLSLCLSWFFFVPSIFILGNVLGYGLYGCWLGSVVYIFLQGMLMFGRFRSGRWKCIKI